MPERGHGELLAHDVGELVGVSGTTVGQWARHGLIRASVSAELPHVYSVEDVGEASIVADLLRRGVRHADVHAAIDRLRELGGAGDWPLSDARLAVTPDGGRARIVLREGRNVFVLMPRGWQETVLPPEAEEVRLRLRRPRRR